ncbi:MAG: T9SS type A sorting domain-containing protein [Bacteroidetes bacterium]|nr:T9SS type A sorting domain-containing protein [Bacteroidota bacterium]
MKKQILFFGLFLLVASSTYIAARAFRVGQIPNGTKNACANCHVNPAGGGPRTAFGTEIERNHMTVQGGSGQVQWSAALAALDSDGDGFTNGQELQDPEGTWVIGQPAPGDLALVTNPGDANDFPNTTSVQPLAGIAGEYLLEGNYPNPFNPSTTIRFQLPEATHARLEIYNSIGARVRVLADERMDAGIYSSSWNGRDDAGRLVESGTYLYRLSAGSFRAVKRMALVK